MRAPNFASSLLLAYLVDSAASAPTAQQQVLAARRGGTRGAVASESRECSAIGRDILAAGGNAVDSLVGTVFCVGVIGMYHSGVGGGGFMIIRDSSGDYEAIDFRETAPASAYQDMYYGNPSGSVVGGLAVAVPGDVRGLEYVHKKYGVLPWKFLMQGAIKLARDGFVVSSDLVQYMEYAVADFTGGYDFLARDPTFAVDFAHNGTRVKEGDIMTRKRYAATLETIAKHGADAFYTGPIAEALIDWIQKHNGTMTLHDLASYKVVSRPPLTTTFRGKFKLTSVPAPASGSVALQILKIMEQYPPSAPFFDASFPGFDSTGSADARNLSIHRMDEAMRFAYAARHHLADPAYVTSVEELEARMLGKDALRRIRDSILDNATQPVTAYEPGNVYAPESHGTTHVVTADASGMATSLTTTINTLFGALLCDPVTGVILNNEMDDFSIPGRPNAFALEPAPENYIRPGKRALSSISPIIVDHVTAERLPPASLLFASLGAAGGSRIATSTAQVTWRVLEHGFTMADALDQPRFHDQLLPNVTTLEYHFDNSTAEILRDRGHDVVWVREGLSTVHGLVRERDASFEAASEPRQRNSAGFTV